MHSIRNQVICIEGTDGAGKTTLVKHVKEEINNLRPSFKVLALSLPNKESFGYDKIRDILKSKVSYPPDVVQSLFIANMIDCADNIIKPFLNESGEDHIVLLDRSLISTIVYNTSTNGTILNSIVSYNNYITNTSSNTINFDIINKEYCHFPIIDYVFFLFPPIDILIKHSINRKSSEENDQVAKVVSRHKMYLQFYNFLIGEQKFLDYTNNQINTDKYISLSEWDYDKNEIDNYKYFKNRILDTIILGG